MHNTSYIIKFTLIMTVVVAFVLALMVSGLKETHAINEAVYNKKAILSAVAGQLGKDVNGLSNSEVQNIFSTQITQKVINMSGDELTADQIKAATSGSADTAEKLDMGKEMKKPEQDRLLPLYIFKAGDGKIYNIVSVRGKGLWDEIWGSIALEDDWKTIAGTTFDHKGETPGLGAEIKDNQSWVDQFTGKTIYNTDGEFTSVRVMKAGAKDKTYQVDGISGATITANGVDEMMRRGLKYYEPYIMKNKK
ncbi:MAG: NADH:ubiquinone reductase (Na(+)-transporting) subunit C [Saprospiraceae bacterium]